MANIFIQLDKPFYFAGETVNGHVLFNVYQNMSGRKLDIKLKGWQAVRWVQTRQINSQQQIASIPANLIYEAKSAHIYQQSSDSSDSDRDERKIYGQKQFYRNEWGQVFQVFRYQGENVMMKFKSVLYDFGGQYIQPGQYSFPFSFKSAENYSASYCDKGINKERKGRIKYEIKASIQGINGKKKKQIKFKTQVIFRETVAVQAEAKQMIANVKSCCCCDQGISKIKCYFDKNAYSPGEQALIHCSLDNSQSKANVTSVEVKLINEIRYTSKTNHSKTFAYTLFTKKFTGLQAGQSQQKQQSVKILNEEHPDKLFIKPTARGKFLNSTYSLRVQAVLDASCTCCSQLPVVNQPILIYPYIPITQNWNQPQNWNPQQMPNFVINMGITGNNQNLNNMSNPYA